MRARPNAPRIARVLLERKAEDGDALARDGVEQTADDALNKATLLVVVHHDHLFNAGQGAVDQHRGGLGEEQGLKKSRVG